MNRRIILLSLTLSTVPAGLSFAQSEEKVLAIVHASNDVKALDAARVKSFYLGNLGFWDNGTRVVVFQRADDSSAAKRFFAGILKMAPSRFRHHWQTLQLSGQGVEPEVATTAESIVLKVASKPGGLGYILESERAEAAANPKVKIVAVE